MAKVRILQPTKTAMQSGRGKTRGWIIEFEPGAKGIESLMGWTTNRETREQVYLTFETCAAAVAFAEKHGLEFEVEAPRQRSLRPKSYADNFRFGREGNWTH